MKKPLTTRLKLETLRARGRLSIAIIKPSDRLVPFPDSSTEGVAKQVQTKESRIPMTNNPTGKVIRLQTRANARLSELIDLFQLLKFGPISTHWKRLDQLSTKIEHLIQVESFCDSSKKGKVA